MIAPLLLGGDLNCYNVARAFHEKYGVVSSALGRYRIGATDNTPIIDFHAVPELNKPDVLIAELCRFRDAHIGDDLILMGCTDDYVTMIIENRERIPPEFAVPYIGAELEAKLTHKESFYTLCDSYGIPHPKTVICSEDGITEPLPFQFPIIIKPSSSVEYWKHPFDGMKKVYIAKDMTEAEKIISEIFAAGYGDRLIIQDYIPGDDSCMYTLTAYSDRGGDVRMMCLGHVLLEEHTPRGLGNHAAIITESNPELCGLLKKLLCDVGYVGFSNFDIKYDRRDGSFRVFEINTRQGRSNYYVTAAGHNIAEYVVSDYIEKREYTGCVMNTNEIYWRYIPDSTVFENTDEPLKSKVKALISSGNAYSSMHYAPDFKRNLKRRLYVLAYELNQRKKFKKYYKRENRNG